MYIGPRSEGQVYKLEYESFTEIAYGVAEDSRPQSNDWMLCQLRDWQLIGVGGPVKLEEIV